MPIIVYGPGAANERGTHFATRGHNLVATAGTYLRVLARAFREATTRGEPLLCLGPRGASVLWAPSVGITLLPLMREHDDGPPARARWLALGPRRKVATDPGPPLAYLPTTEAAVRAILARLGADELATLEADQAHARAGRLVLEWADGEAATWTRPRMPAWT